MGANQAPALKVEVNFEDDPFQRQPAYLEAQAPISFWRMNALSGATENDLGTNNLDLTYVNAPTLGVDGAFADSYNDLDTSVSFNGTDEYGATATSATWQNLTAAWTLAAWIYPTASRSGSNGGSGIIAVDRAVGSTAPFHLSYGALPVAGIGDVVWGGWWNAAGNAWHAKDTASPTLNAWTHYVCTWNGTTISLYRNAVLVDDFAPGAAATATSAAVAANVGRNSWGGTLPYFPGRIDEPAVWNIALTATQIANLYRYFSITDPDEGNYIDLSDRVRSASSRRGRSDNTSRVEAGAASVVLDNRDGVLFPDPIVNRLANPSAEANETGLPFSSENGTVARATAQKRSGNYSWSLTTSNTSPAYLTTERDGLVGIRPGETVVFAPYVYVTTAGAVDLADVTPQIVYEVAGTRTVVDGSNPANFDAWERPFATTTIPDDADVAFVRVELDAGAGAEVIYVDDVQLEEGSSPTTYCDGDQTDCRWGGEPHLSLSHRKRVGSYSKIIPMRRARVQGTWDGTDYGVLAGYITRWDYNYPGTGGADSTATISIVDATRVLAAISMRGFSRSAERPGDRIRAIFDYAGINAADYSVDDQYIEALSLSAQTAIADDTTALELIRRIEETERGVLLADADGVLTYQGSLLRSTEVRESIILGDNGYAYTGLSASLDVQGVVNDTRIENLANPSTDHHFIETESQIRYFVASAAENSYWSTDDVSYVDRSTPLVAASEIELAPARDPDAMWPDVLGLELGALARVDRVYNGIDVFAGELQTIEGIAHDAARGVWNTRLLTAPELIAPISVDPWQTPIAKPILFTSKEAFGHGGGTITMPSKTYKAGRLYVMFANLRVGGGTAPVAPGFTSGNTWTSIRADTGISTSSWRHQTFWTKVGGSDVTEALALTFAGTGPERYNIVVLEISAGFESATPIADSNQSTVVSAFAGFIDVGTLTDAESIVLGGVWKDEFVTAQWSGGVELYEHTAFKPSYSVAYGRIPGVDRLDFSWAAANGYHGTGFEVEAS